MSIGKNIKQLRKLHNLTQKELAEIAGVSDKAVSTWESGTKDPRMGAIQKIADHFGLNKSDIIEEKQLVVRDTSVIREDTAVYSHSHSAQLPLLGSIAAGSPLEMIPVKEYVNVPHEVAELHPHGYLVTVNGDSMNKIVPENALALIDPTCQVNSGDVVVVAVNGYEATLKRMYHFKDGIALEPESYNESHSTVFLDKETLENTPVSVKGKLVWFMSSLNPKF